MKTHILMVLDESGSMIPQRNDVVGGFNNFITEQKSSDDECVVSLIKFNTSKQTVFSAIPIEEVQLLTPSQYSPSGFTALYDAVAEAISLGEEVTSDRVLCVVVTDGEENSSKEISFEKITSLIKDHEAMDNWTFVYLGVDPLSWAQQVGMSASNTRSYDPTRLKKDLMDLSVSTSLYRSAANLSVKEGFLDSNSDSDSQ